MVRIFFVICVQMVFLGCKLSYAQKSVHKNITVKNTVPIVYNYNYAAYGAGIQNWAITQSENKRLYIANNQGVLEFTGADWKKYPIKGVCAIAGSVQNQKFVHFYPQKPYFYCCFL